MFGCKTLTYKRGNLQTAHNKHGRPPSDRDFMYSLMLCMLSSTGLSAAQGLFS